MIRHKVHHINGILSAISGFFIENINLVFDLAAIDDFINVIERINDVFFIPNNNILLLLFVYKHIPPIINEIKAYQNAAKENT